MENPTNTPNVQTGADVRSGASRPQRWSAARKQEIVLRLLRGEPLDAIAREIGVEPYRLERWRDRALAAMSAGLKERAEADPLQASLAAAPRRVGELSMENELLREKITRLAFLFIGRGRANERGDLASHSAALWRAAGLPHLGRAALKLLSSRSTAGLGRAARAEAAGR